MPKDLLFYRPGDYSLIPNGSVVVLSDNEQLESADGAMLAARGIKVCVLTADNEQYALNADAWMSYLAGLRAKIQRKGLTLWGIMPSEEWWDRINTPGVMAWSCFRAMARVAEDMQARKTFLLPHLKRMVAQVKVAFPGVPVVTVEARWNENTASGPGLWYPDYGGDVIGLDAYMSTQGFDFGGGLRTPPLRAGTDRQMLDKFGVEVTWMLRGWPDGRVTGALRLGKPVLLVAQTFRDRPDGAMWSMPPKPEHLQWWHDISGDPQVKALGFFCVESAPSVIGLDGMPDLMAKVESIARAIGAAPAPVTPTPAPAPAPTPPTPAGATVLGVSPDGRFRAVLQNDGNLVVYAVATGKPVGWTGAAK